LETLNMSLVITGASGHLGRRTAELLLEHEGVEPFGVVLVTRDPSKLSDFADRGVAVRAGNFDDPSSLPGAFAGATRVLVVSTDGVGRRVAQHRAAFEAARDAGASFIAYTSLPNPVVENPAGVATEHRETEAALAEVGVPFAVLRNALYAEYRVPEAQAALASGTFHYNTGDGVSAYVSREDCAAAGAAVLAGGEHDGRAYDITGPELLSGPDLAGIYAAVGGAEVAAVAVSDEEFVAGAIAGGVPAEVAPFIATFGEAVRVGALDQLSGDVEALTGTAPRTVRDVLAGALAATA
jgi:NAD(P)H dehydrogenase (quinone)